MCIINLSTISTIKPTSYLFNSTIKPNPKPFQLKGKLGNLKP